MGILDGIVEWIAEQVMAGLDLVTTSVLGALGCDMAVATGSISQMGSISGEKAAEALHSYMGYAALESGAENVPTFQNVEIGGGRITGTEVTAEHPEGISFGMYHADQYVAPEGQYTTIHAVDGTAWYKQYAVDAVDKSPYMAPDGSIAFNESIVKKLPPSPKRKDKI